jgi:hypothetical protein
MTVDAGAASTFRPRPVIRRTIAYMIVIAGALGASRLHGSCAAIAIVAALVFAVMVDPPRRRPSTMTHEHKRSRAPT